MTKRAGFDSLRHHDLAESFLGGKAVRLCGYTARLRLLSKAKQTSRCTFAAPHIIVVVLK